MSKITIPKEAMKYATRLSSNDKEFYKNSNKFAEIMHQHYPHLSRHEIDEINHQITLKGISVSTLFELQTKAKKEMYEMYLRYLGYKKRGDYENLADLTSIYKDVNKKCYDRRVDELKELGHNTQYAPDNVADIKRFVNYDVNQQDIQTFIICSVILGLISLLYLL
jgi:hypothetical protein